jgi:hypothetical protein
MRLFLIYGKEESTQTLGVTSAYCMKTATESNGGLSIWGRWGDGGGGQAADVHHLPQGVRVGEDPLLYKGPELLERAEHHLDGGRRQ